MLSVAIYTVLARNPDGSGAYTLTAAVQGAVGALSYTWLPSVPNRPLKSGNPVTRSFSSAATQWSETLTVTDASGQRATATVFLDLVTDSPAPPPPPSGVPQITIDAAQEAALLAVPIGGDIELVGPAMIHPAHRQS
jgi:hypothetical protein